MENVKNIKEDTVKRSIEEVDDDCKDINERSKKLKSENQNTVDTKDSVESMTCDYEVKSDGHKTNEIKAEKKEDGGVKEDEAIQVIKPKINYTKKKKCALLLSYCGSGYNGMQRNPGVKTIEEDLTNALFKARAISEDASRNYGKMSFQRCARTDKGVSAARQVVSLKMVPYQELLPEINKHLESQIRVFALKQVTRGFDCKSRCSSRTYQYLLPTFAFAPTYAHTTKDFRIGSERINELNQLLKKYEGTKNFHNFTSGKGFQEESAKRYIIKFHVAGEPFIEKELEFLVLQVQGQSFMQHQIRKMIGLVIAIMKNFTGSDAINRSFQEPKMDIPRAPGLGLILDQVHFKSYNERFGRDGFHQPLEWSDCEDQIQEFKKRFIYSQIIETEATTKSMMRWLNTLSAHTYSNVGMAELQSNKDLNNSAEPFTETSNNSTMIPSDAMVKTELTCEDTSSSCTPATSTNDDQETSSSHIPSEVVVETKPTCEDTSSSCTPATSTNDDQETSSSHIPSEVVVETKPTCEDTSSSCTPATSTNDDQETSSSHIIPSEVVLETELTCEDTSSRCTPATSTNDD